MNDTKYKIYPAAKRQTVNQSVMDKAVNIEEYVKAQFTDSVNKALNYIATQTGRSLAGTAIHAALTAPPGSPVVDGTCKVVEPEGPSDDELLAAAPPRTAASPALAASREIDAEFDDMAPAAAPATASDDDLLAEIDKLAA